MTQETPAPAVDPEDFMDRYRAFEQRAAELHPANKASLFAALAAAAIGTVTVTFDGSGDSGQIEQIEVDGDEASFPDTPVELARTHLVPTRSARASRART